MAPTPTPTPMFSDIRVSTEGGEPVAPSYVGPSVLLFRTDTKNCRSMCNAIRRIILSEVETVAVPPHKVVIVKNTTTLNNELICQRLSLTFVHVLPEELRNWAGDGRYEFSIDVENSGLDVKAVTSKDIRVIETASKREASPEVRNRLFPPNAMSKDHVLLAYLRGHNNVDPGTDALHVKFVATRGIGRDGASWSPVSRCAIKNVIDEAAYERALLAEHGATPSESARRQFAVLDGLRQFKVDVDDVGEPGEIEMTIHSETSLHPAFLVSSALDVLISKVKSMAKLDTSLVTISRIGQADMYRVAVLHEDDTLGDVVQSMLFRRWRSGESVTNIGYTVQHPLERVVVFNLKLAASETRDVRDVLRDGLDWVVADLADKKAAWSRATSSLYTV